MVGVMRNKVFMCCVFFLFISCATARNNSNIKSNKNVEITNSHNAVYVPNVNKINSIKKPSLANGGDPIMNKVAGGDPIMNKTSLGDPIMVNAAGDPIMQPK